jgi:hypothetical protein
MINKKEHMSSCREALLESREANRVFKKSCSFLTKLLTFIHLGKWACYDE